MNLGDKTEFLKIKTVLVQGKGINYFIKQQVKF